MAKTFKVDKQGKELKTIFLEPTQVVDVNNISFNKYEKYSVSELNYILNNENLTKLEKKQIKEVLKSKK